jgi:hypothetical protein
MAEVSNTELQTQLLKLLVDPTFMDRRLGRGQSYLAQALRAKFPSDSVIRQQQIMQVVWQLVSQGLAYIDFSQPSPENWELHVTKAGAEAARDEALNPDNFGEYLKELVHRVPAASPTVLQYATEAGNAYVCRCYFASTVMLGVASEAAFLEMARSFSSWLPKKQGDHFRTIVDSPRTNYISKFSEFRKRVEPHKPEIPAHLSDGMTLSMDAVLDLLRINRNDAGHPTGRTIGREDAFISLQMFARYLQKLYAFKAFFESETN